MPNWLIDLLVAGAGIPILLRLIPNKKLTAWGQWLARGTEQGRRLLYKLAYKGGFLLNALGHSKLGGKAWEKIESGTIEAIFKGFIDVEGRASWSAPIAISYGLLDGLNEGEKGYQKRGP